MDSLLVKEDKVKHKSQQCLDKIFNGENENITINWMAPLMTLQILGAQDSRIKGLANEAS